MPTKIRHKMPHEYLAIAEKQTQEELEARADYASIFSSSRGKGLRISTVTHISK